MNPTEPVKLTFVEEGHRRKEEAVATVEIPVPEPPVMHGALGAFPENLRKAWKKTYVERYRQTITDEGQDYRYASPAEQHARRHRAALREANRIFATPECTCYKDAAALEDWQVMVRKEEAGVLKIVTIDAKKHVFPVPQAS